MNNLTVSGIPSYISDYTGQPITFSSLSVSYNNQLLTENTDYSIAYSNNTDPGIAALIISGIGSYDFRKDILFTITREDEDPGYQAVLPGPFNDLSLQQLNISQNHNTKIDEGAYNEAIAILDRGSLNSYRAGTFNALQEKLRYTQEYLLNKKSPEYRVYSRNEPESSRIPIWVQEY